MRRTLTIIGREEQKTSVTAKTLAKKLTLKQFSVQVSELLTTTERRQDSIHIQVTSGRTELRSRGAVQQHDRAAVMSPSQAAQAPEMDTWGKGSGFRRRGLVAGIVLLVGVGWIVAYGNYFTPRSTLGFNLGLIGSLIMLMALLGYPLRKHTRCMQRWGVLKQWFRLHLFFGIIGPILVLFHTTFHVRSLNAGIALASMLLVVASGLIGRYLYAMIHLGLYGRRATLQELQEQFSPSSEDAKSRLHFAPRVDHWLQRFASSSIHTERRFPFSLFWFLTLAMRRKILEFRCARELQWIMHNRRIPEFPGGAPEAIGLVGTYLKGVQRVEQFTTYERIFSLWHVLHIPLIYILVGSTAVHIVAVYMY